MKRNQKYLTTLLLVSLLTLTQFSCTQDDPTPEELLTGTWNSGIITIVPSVGTAPLAVWLSITMGLSQTEALLYSSMFSAIAQSAFSGSLEFRSDKTFTWTMPDRTESGTWSLNSDGTELTLTPSASIISISGTVEVSELNESSLKMHISATLNQDITNDGTPEAINIEADLSFTRKE